MKCEGVSESMETHVGWPAARLCFVLLVLHGAQAEQPYRTAYHFQPLKNWMNDPNGPMYYKGVYHLFYQHNPEGAVWRQNITWGHSISYDLVNWVHVDHALNPSQAFDINGCWSGSATFLPGGNPLILYTGIDSRGHQVQNLAMPKNLSDPKLIEWVKSPRNPLMLPPEGIKPDSYRDPTTAWLGPDEVWRVIVGAEENGHGLAFMYRSDDFLSWNRTLTPLHSSEKTVMWECPDFYPVKENGNYGSDTSAQDEDLKHVLKVSYNSQDSYILGHYDAKGDNFVVESDFVGGGLDKRYDYGKFYASKTFYDPVKKRRILWGWVNESDSEADWIQRGWSGLQSFPRSVLLSKNGKQLIQWPIEEIEKLRKKQVNIQGKKLEGGSLLEVSGVTASQADVEVSFSLPNLTDAEILNPAWVNPQLICSTQGASDPGKLGPFGLLVLASENLSEQTAVFFKIFRRNGYLTALMCSDQSRSSLRGGIDKTTYGTFIDLNPLQKTISLRSLIDHSIVESFGENGLACITARVYPSIAVAESAHLYAFNNGTEPMDIASLTAWSMKSARLVPVMFA
uniref:Uncharacterized protein n=2 Tax=Kalanchoe fedtschenkoi TaxID=63787 RepID=A0A7N0VBM8_KALFE